MRRSLKLALFSANAEGILCFVHTDNLSVIDRGYGVAGEVWGEVKNRTRSVIVRHRKGGEE